MPRCLSTPRLESVKAKIVRDQKTRTDRKIEVLLRPRQTREDEEVSDDSEEDNRVRVRRAPSNRDQATQTDKSYSSKRTRSRSESKQRGRKRNWLIR